ncbi:hypothetical protein PHYPSEUDO_014343 [Phytophthora pseudosyringae]|uniref:CCHC-type domain-containing protein n=1 Tax=Phytophthora pseudosyringae TaxID=221518 RepID=A0A8T1WHH3_9STRA|nr:hypothetical protein PHYPSEUDO_014343 [Phytophthora pseudosyringae]
MEYERTHASFPASQERPRRQERQQYHERSYDRDGPEPMEIGNTRFLDRSECMSRNLCVQCKRPGHRMRDCRSGERAEDQQSHYEEKPCVPPEQGVHNVDVEDDTELLFDLLTVNAASVHITTGSRRSLVRKEGTVSMFGTPVTILMDSGADHNVIRPGLSEVVVRRKLVFIERFDGQTTEDVMNEVEADICMGQYGFHRLLFTEYTLPCSHDVIRVPWFARYNTDIDWVTHEVNVAEPDADYDELDAFIDEVTEDLGAPVISWREYLRVSLSKPSRERRWMKRDLPHQQFCLGSLKYLWGLRIALL